MDNYVIDNTNNGGQFKQFTQTIAPGEIYTIQEPFISFRVLALNNPTACEYRLGRNASWTPVETGVGLRFPNVLPSVSIKNKSNAPVIITVALAIGDITDDRTTFTGSLDVKVESPTLANYQGLTFDESGTVTVNGTDYQNIFIQNKGENPIHLFGPDGLVVQPGGDFSADFGGEIPVYGIEGDSIGVLMFD